MPQCGVALLPIIFKRLKWITSKNYKRSKREFIGESKSFKMSGKYFDFAILRFHEQSSRSNRNLGHFRKFEKISKSQNTNISCIILKWVIWIFQIYNLFREIFKFREDKPIMYFEKFFNAFVKPRKILRKILYIWNLQITCSKIICDMFVL